MIQRYSIYNATVEMVKNSGGTNIKCTSNGIIFATLDIDAVQKLLSYGCILRPIKELQYKQYNSGDDGYRINDVVQLLGFPITDFDGSGTYVAVVDSGIRSTHELLSGRVVYSENFTSEADGDFFNHGTGIASIIADMSQCNILDMHVMTSVGVATDESVSLALDRCIQLHDSGYSPLIINMSLGNPDDGDIYDPIYVMCNDCLSHGIYIVAAAGNKGATPNAIDLPSSIRGVICVGSVSYFPDEQYPFIISPFSSRGPSIYGDIKPDVVMPGDNLKVASATGDDEYIVKRGTSFATPVVSAILSFYIEAVNRGESSIYEPHVLIDKYLRYACVKPKFITLQKDNEYGFGMIQGELFKNSVIYGNIPADIVTSSTLLLSLAFVTSTATMMVSYE